MSPEAYERGRIRARKLRPFYERLGRYYTVFERNRWLNHPHPLLAGQRPIDLIMKGNGASVKAVLDQLDSGAYT